MKYLVQTSEPEMEKFWQLIIDMIEENYVTDDNKDDYLVLGINTLANVETIKQSYLQNINYRKLIVYQLEPLTDRHWIPPERILEYIQGYDEIWDYDIENIEYLQKLGYNPKFKPMRYTKKLETFDTADNPKIDILFVGSSTDSRIYHMNHIMWNRKFPFNIFWANGILGKELDYWMSQSKIILNLSTHWKNNRQAQTRIFYALNNNKLVLSQCTNVNYFGDNIVQFNSQDHMIERIEFLLNNQSWKSNVNFNKNNLFHNKTKISIFVYLEQHINWREKFTVIIQTLQAELLFDCAEYIQISFSGNERFEYSFDKINRIKHNQNKIDFMQDTTNFAYLNPFHRLLVLNNIDNNDIVNLNRFLANYTTILDNLFFYKILISKNIFWYQNKDKLCLKDVSSNENDIWT